MGKITLIAEPLPDLKLIQPKVFEDQRGYFMESYNKNDLKEIGINVDFVQDNQAKSSYGVIRGLHYQISPYAQSKLIRVIKGRILDVALDIRRDSPTFGQYFIVELSEDNFLQLFIPKGFAHGYSVLVDNTIVFYKTDEFYNASCEAGIYPLDAQLNIDWGLKENEIVLSHKDKNLPMFSKAKYF